MNRTVLLNPGPVTLSARVRAALAEGPDLCHREDEFVALLASIRARILAIYDLDPGQWEAILLSGSGTAAVEAMVTSFVPRNGHLLVAANGVYGERMALMARVHGISCSEVNAGWLEPLDPALLERRLAESPDITHLATVHHETTTGRLNDIAGVAEICQRRGVVLLLDAVSSFGAEALAPDHWPLGGLAATANKCLHGVPGISFVVAERSRLAAAGNPQRSLYLDLPRYLAAQQAGTSPFTHAVQACLALGAALEEFFDEGGWRGRHQRYARRLGQIADRCTLGGATPLLPVQETSVVLNAWRLPPALGYQTLHDRLKAAGFVIYAGQGALSAEIFRLSPMGDIQPEELSRLCQVLPGALAGDGYSG